MNKDWKTLVDILVSKLQTPKRYHVLHRRRLIRIFEDFHQSKLGVVTAGAGYGKTTLVKDALENLNINCIWYRLDDQDTDFPVFISYLYSAIQDHVSDPNGFKINEKVPRPNLQKQTEALLKWLCLVEKVILRPTVLVLDDYHLVQESDQIREAIEFIIERLSDQVHMVIIGRRNLNLKLSGLRAGGQLLEISETDLAFTVDEIRRFFTQTQGLSDAQIKDIHSNTGGWAASLVLLRYAFLKHRPTAVANHLELFRQTPNHIFSYLKENIFDVQPDHIKSFMMKAALLPEIDTRRCKKIFDIDDADLILRQMIEDHLMIFPVDESGRVFYFHHLFRDFLIAQINQTYSISEIQKLHCSIARKIQEDDIFMALHHFVEGHAFEDAIRIVDNYDMDFLLEGKINFLDRCLKKIPGKIIEKNPQLLLAQAKLFTYFGDPGQATKMIGLALKQFKKQKSKENMVKCIVELGSQYYFTGYVKEAKLLMEQILDDVEKTSATYIIAMTYLTFLSSVLGEFKTAARYYQIVRDEIKNFPEFEQKAYSALINTSYSYTLYINGEFERAQKFNEKLLHSVLELKLAPCSPLVYYQLSATCFYLGDFETGVDYAKKGIGCCEDTSLSDSRKGWVYLARAHNHLGLAQFEKAIKYIDKSFDLFEMPGNRWGMANAWECLYQVYLGQKKFESAKQILGRAFDIIKGYGLVLTQGILENDKAHLFIMEKKYSDALECLETARPKLFGASYHLFNNHMLSLRSYFESGNTTFAAHHLSCALSLCETHSYDRFVNQAQDWLIPLVRQVSSTPDFLNEKDLIYIQTILKADITGHVKPMHISLLGRFKLILGDRELPLSAWKSSKALMILKYLTANRKKGFIPREVLIEMLWPDQDPQKTGSRFNMAMSSLRKTLEPDLSPKAPSSYIERKKDMYRLFNERQIKIDTELFFNAVAQAKAMAGDADKALESYLLAESLYKDVFLNEDLYQEWCIQQREYFISELILVLKSVVTLYEEKKDYVRGIFFAKKILAVDPSDETAFKYLMIFYAKTGNLPRVTKVFKAYLKNLKQMDCPVSPDMKSLFADLVKI
ncbi:MAG: transcriptional regulator [Desulfobacter sp.]|nr:MAG: transcriptional regulator [Desulfobacter sp.]